MQNFKLLLFLLVILFMSLINLEAQEEDSVKNYWLNQIEISEKKLNLGEANNKISKDNLSNILDNNGFTLIRKGVFFAQDIYADGLKKGDINVVIDGERYHSACPNRMDSPLTRINPLELESVTLSKSSSNLQSGLGGIVQFNRSLPQDNLRTQIALSTVLGAQSGIDLAASTDYKNHKITLRYADGNSYKDGEGNTFSDQYNFKENYNFTLAEGSIRGKFDDLAYGISFSYTDNVSFPYLLMDERVNRVYSAHVSYKQNKIYFNYTDHVMDNDLRESPMLMKTDAKNLTIGAVGEFYEVIYRNWDANNFFDTPMVYLENDLMPDVSTYSANIFKDIEFAKINFYGKLGFSYHNVGETSREDFYSTFTDDVKLSRFFPTFSLGISKITSLSKEIGIGGSVEVNSESPETESLYISVKKPMGKPSWSGNTNLDQAIKSTVRGSFYYNDFRLELFGSQIWNYNNLVKQMVDESAYLTYKNIDAMILGTNLNFENKYLQIDASYVWAENQTNDSPLSEIPPLKISTKLISPQMYNTVAYVKHTYSDAQKRVDLLLNETTSNAWNKIDLGFMVNLNQFSILVDVENLLDSNYYQHLSYLRDPFSSGLRVFDPGRTFRITLQANSLF